MFKTFVTSSTLISEEPTLLNYLDNGDMDLDDILSTANEHMINDLSNRNILLKKICTPLAITKDLVVEDKIERKRFVINVNAISDDCMVTLKGRNYSTDSYTEIFSDLLLSTVGEYNKLITNPYVYYYMELSNSTGLTYSAYLIETAFDLPLTKYALYLAYKRLQMLSGDIYTDKAEMYRQEYLMLMNNIVFSYNTNLSSDVTEDDKTHHKITFRR